MPGEPMTHIELELAVAALPANVWRALADPSERRRWWSYLDLDATPGGRVVERWRDASGREVTTTGAVSAAEAPRLLCFTWRDEDWSSATDVELSIHPDGPGTLVRLRHAGWERLGQDGRELRDAHEGGWRIHLANLKAHAERR